MTRSAHAHTRCPHAAGCALALLAALAAGCSDDDGGGPGTNPGQNPFGAQLPASTGDPDTDRLIATAATCGFQSFNTVPVGWRMVPIGEQGCAIWTPPGWTAIGAGTAVTSVEGNAAGTLGALSMAGVPPVGTSVSCTPKGATAYLLQGVEADGCAGVKQLYYAESTMNLVGMNVPKADVTISCTDSGQQIFGYLLVSITGTTPLCNILSLGFWMPRGEIAQHTCTLTQILQSVRCPTPGGSFCSDSECDADCKAMGRSGGACDASDSCQCS